MKLWQKYVAGLVMAASVASPLMAQPPAVPAAPAAAGGLLGLLSKDNLKKCKSEFCAKPIGQLISNMLKPLSILSGGLIQCCPVNQPTPEEVAAAKAKGGAAGAAAEIQAEQAAAKATREAIRYLATVDCYYYPNVADELITALLTNRNECVRWEAALALQSGCCCTKNTIIALTVCLEGAGKTAPLLDGKVTSVPERSERVKAAAFIALQNCLACYIEKVEGKKDGGGEKPPVGTSEDKGVTQAEGGNIWLASFHKRCDEVEPAKAIEEAKRVLSGAHAVPVRAGALSSGHRSVMGIVGRSVGEPMTRPVGQPTTEQPPTAEAQEPKMNGAVSLKIPAQQPAAEVPPAPVTPVSRHKIELPIRGGKAAEAPPAPVTLVSHETTQPLDAGSMTCEQLVVILRDSPQPFKREWAAKHLVNSDWRNHAEAVPTLWRTAKEDKSPAVRCECIRSLARMNVNSAQVSTALEILKNDNDPRVRAEVEAAIKGMPGSR